MNGLALVYAKKVYLSTYTHPRIPNEYYINIELQSLNIGNYSPEGIIIARGAAECNNYPEGE
jgi:hypothetical protein